MLLNKQVFDPFYSLVVLLLDGRGTDGSTVIRDVSRYARTGITAFVDAQISSAQARFGGTSLRIATAANASRIEIPDSSELRMTTGDFTLEVSFRLTTLSSGIILTKQAGTGNYPWQIYTTGTNKISFRAISSGLTLVVDLTGTTTLVTGTWYSVHVTRKVDTFTLSLNGAVEAQTTIAGGTVLYSSVSDKVLIGNYTTGTFPVQGNIDELRITAGLARPLINQVDPFPTS